MASTNQDGVASVPVAGPEATEPVATEPVKEPSSVDTRPAAVTTAESATNGASKAQSSPSPAQQPVTHTPVQPSGISRDEVALYDRQIRLWGLQAQEQIRNAHILLVDLKALGNEIAKNLVLSGIGSLTISDPTPVTHEDLGSQFFISEEDIGKSRAEAALPRIQKLNSRVNVSILGLDPLNPPDATYLAPFTIVIGTDLPVTSLNVLSTACRFAQKPFFAGGCHGIYGFIFADLISHTFAITRDPPNIPTQPGSQETPTRTVVSSAISESAGKRTELVTKREDYQPFLLVNSAPLPEAILRSPRRLRQVPALLPFLRALWQFESAYGGQPPHTGDKNQIGLFTQLATEKSRELQLPFDLIKSEGLRSFLQNVYLELAPTAAFLGASLAQDVINVLSKREQPIQNMLLFDGDENKVEIFALYPMVTTQDVGGL